jgi:DNA transformation protein
MAARSRYVEFVTERLSPLGEITSRAMFGGHTLYCDGVVFALIAADELFLKVDEVNRADFEAAGSRPFKPFEDQDSVMRYYSAPADLFESDEGVERWGRSAVEAGRRAQKKKRSSGGRTKRVRTAR